MIHHFVQHVLFVHQGDGQWAACSRSRAVAAAIACASGVHVSSLDCDAAVVCAGYHQRCVPQHRSVHLHAAWLSWQLAWPDIREACLHDDNQLACMIITSLLA